MKHLRDRNVDVTSIGKLHYRSGEDDNGFSEEILPMHVVGGVGWAAGLLRDNFPKYDGTAELAADVGVGASTYTDYDRAITKATEHWLAGKTNADRPWAAFVSLVSPHYPLTAPKEFYDLYDPTEMDLPIAYEPSQRPDHSELNNVAGFFNYDQYFDDQKIREAKAAYYGLISFMDHCVGRILTALQKSGQREDTIIIYTSDHGDMMGDHGFWTKQIMYEASAGVPMIACGPGIPKGRHVKTGTSLLDLAATAIDVTGVDHSEWSSALPGTSLLALANQPDDADRTIFAEYHDGGSSTGTFMVRWDRWKYIHYVGHAPQLFDLADDPDEMNDLVSIAPHDSAIEAALKEGERRLRSICDPDEVNRLCFQDQQQRIEDLGGREACENAYLFGHTPTPDEQQKMAESSPL